MMRGRLISNLFGLTQNNPWRVWVYGLKEREPAAERNIKSLLNSACLRLTNKFRHPFFYHEEAIISLVDIGDSFKTDDYILEKQLSFSGWFLNGQEMWGTFINSFANLLMSKGTMVETVSKGVLREYTLDVEFINNRPYLRIDFGHALFFPEDLDRQLEKGGKPEIGGKYYTPNRKIAILKDCTKLSKEDYKKLMEEMLPRSLEETKVAWEEGLKRAIRRGYGYIAKVVFNENDRREYTYPANALVKVRYMGDLSRGEWEQVRPLPQQRWELIKKFRHRVASHLGKYSIDLDEEPYTEIEYIAPSFEVIDGSGKARQISGSVGKLLDFSDWKPIIRNPHISVGFLYLYTNENSFRDLESRTRIIADTVLKTVSSFGMHIDRIEPIWVPLSEYKENRLLSRYIENFDGLTRFLFVLTDTLKLDDEFYWDIKGLLGFGIQSQVIYHRTNVRNENVAKNLMLAFLGKTGNYPYFLKETSNKVFVGIDLSRKARSSGKGTVNAVGTAIIVDLANGGITYKNINGPAGGEAVEKAYVKSLANMLYQYKDNFIVIHRDGGMSRDEFNAYVEIFSRQFGKESFALVSIIKSGTPRILQMKGHVVENPPKGCVIWLSESEAVISTYKTSQSHGTHVPLRIKVLYGDYPLREAIEDVLKLTLLNFSSFTLNKLPATVAFADRVAWFALHNIFPNDSDGNLFFL
ncbi:MAG: Piwi domain-containing protein [Thermocrinis sp.]|jgi:hypothetical protein|uniref:Piwi domain-containing protein n=1 Tax=Thermocrinis sp. TaxID=2024383 RepID=UPI003C0F1F7F